METELERKALAFMIIMTKNMDLIRQIIAETNGNQEVNVDSVQVVRISDLMVFLVRYHDERDNRCTFVFDSNDAIYLSNGLPA